MTPAAAPRLIGGLADIARDYDALYCDLWGCYHDGVRPYPAAVAALQAFRAQGGTVILLTNAPRPSADVGRILAAMGAPADSFDAIVSSGDAARFALETGRVGRRVEHVGPARDLPFFEGVAVERVGRAEAEGVVCTGLFDDETETPDDYARAVADWMARGLPMLCANPDIVAHREGAPIWCAGAIAQAYAAAGGAVIHAGKPHAAIYRLAAERLSSLRGHGARVLAIGDGVATDIVGGAAAGIDTLFIGAGIAVDEVLRPDGTLDPARLGAFLAREGAAATYAIDRLR
jgi:HAD superfamily hydrolase (TIGR01459 family)